MGEDSKSRESILRQFDDACDDVHFPDLGHGYYYTIDARLRAYADARRWALAVEVVGYNPRGADVYDVMHTFGNCVMDKKPGSLVAEDFFGRIDNSDQIQDKENPETASGAALVVRGQTVDVGVKPGEELVDVFRRLVPEHRELLLAYGSELGQRVPAGLPEVLCLDEWHQPNIYESMPSESETYQLLAEVLANGDASRYQPTLEPNTQWSNWPESGSL